MTRWFLLIGGLLLSAAGAAPLQKEGVSVELVSERAGVRPGEELCVGLVFKHAPGFHTYWRQPGIVGLAPSLKWDLPPGLKAGEIVWPAPERSKMGIYGVWGFERDVCLLVPVQVSCALKPGTEITLKAQAVWMACGRTCHPGSGDLSLTLPVLKECAPTTEHASLFAQTHREQALLSPDWEIQATRTDTGFELIVKPRAPGVSVPEGLYFYSYARLADSHAAQVDAPDTNGARRLRIGLVEFPDAWPSTLEGELYAPAGWGQAPTHHFLRVSAPLAVPVPAPAKKD